MKTIKLLATITVTDDYFIDEPYWTLENAVSESSDEELESVEIYEPPVIDVDLKKEFKDFINCDNGRTMFDIAKYFFELGLLKAQKGE